MGVPTHFVKLISNLYDNQQACVRTEKGDSDWFNIGQGVRQGCILSPTLFNLYAEYIMRRVLENWNGGLSIGGYKLSNLRYADDTTLAATSALELEELLLIVKAKSEALGLRLNVSKTKIMSVVCYHAMVGLNKIWTDRGITKATKKRLVSALIFPIATYGCESWTLTKADQSSITSFEMWCWRRMLRISWYMKRSNISVLEEIQPKRRLLSHVQSQMMKYFGHIARRGGNSLEKVIMQGCVEGRRKPGRPRTRWIDQIKSMVGCPLHELYNLVQDRQRWCDVVAVASCQS